MLLDLFGLWYAATKRAVAGVSGGYLWSDGTEKRVFDSLDALLAYVKRREGEKLDVVKKLKTAKRIRKARPPLIHVRTEDPQVQQVVDDANERIRRAFEAALTERINELDDEEALLCLMLS